MADENKNKKDSQQYNNKVVDLKNYHPEAKPISEIKKTKKNDGIVHLDNANIRVFFSWTISDTPPAPKGPIWYLIAIIVVLGLIILSIIQKNWLFIIILLVGIFAYFTMSRREPLHYEVKVSDEGVGVGKDFFSFSQLMGFGFYVKRGKDFFVLETNSFTQRFIVLPLKVNKDKLGDFLIRYIPEKEYEESMSDMLEEILRF